MLADDLVAGIAFDQLGAGIPVGHPAIRIEHVDCIILYSLDQLAEALLAFEQGAFGKPPVGQVAGDFRIADQPARRVADRVDDCMGPETRAVLAHPPAFGFEPARVGGGLEDAGGQTRLAVFGQEEGCVGAADNLVRLIALEAARAGIPGRDRAVGIDHVDGVIDHRVDQHLEALFLWIRGAIGHGIPAERGLAARAENPSARRGGLAAAAVKST
jgi:hypothetical protein